MQGFLSFTEKLVQKAKGEAATLFRGSVAAITDELKWFEELAASRNLNVGFSPNNLLKPF